MKLFTFFTAASLCFATTFLSAQDAPKKDEHKIQEVVSLDATAAAPTPNADGTMPVDTGIPAAKPLGSGEILKRAVNFVKIENSKYVKSSGVNSGSRAECVVTFKYKPKELNPQADVEGTITMHISIEAKEGKYRYTISKISHAAKNPEMSGGDVYNDVPKCGSMKLPPNLWSKIKGEAIKDAAAVTSDLKEAMKVPSDAPQGDKDEW
jgi:hypothetical protein